MNNNGGDDSRRPNPDTGGDPALSASEALKRFIRSRWETRDANLFLTSRPRSNPARPIQSGPRVPPPEFRPAPASRPESFASAQPISPRPWPQASPLPQSGFASPKPPPYQAPGPSSATSRPVNRHESGIIDPESSAKGREMLKHWKDIRECQLCPLGRTRHKFVYGMGRADTRLVFIGEAPGQQEDQMGLPFVGASGKMLDGILAGLGLTRDSYFICNVLKCRPPENRNPQPDEIEKCAPYLEKQMEILAPKYVVALGTFAAQSILKTIKPIGQLRGRWHQMPAFEVLPVYHPSAACRSGANKKVLEEDLLFLKKRLDGDGAKTAA